MKYANPFFHNLHQEEEFKLSKKELNVAIAFHLIVFLLAIYSFSWMGVMAPLFSLFVCGLTPKKYHYLKETSRRSFNFFAFLTLSLLAFQTFFLILPLSVLSFGNILMNIMLVFFGGYMTMRACYHAYCKKMYEFPPSIPIIPSFG